MTTDDFFTVREVTERTGFTRQNIYILMSDGALERYVAEKGGTVYVTGTSLRDYMLKRIGEWTRMTDKFYLNLPETGLRERLAETRKALQETT